MADDEIRKETPRPDARPEARLPQHDNNRIRHPDLGRNPMARIAFWLGVFSFIPPGSCLTLPLWPPLNLWPPLHSPGKVVTPCILQFMWLAWFWRFMWLAPLLGLAALIYGILGVRYRNRNPTAGGLGYAISGIVIGILTCLLGSFFLNILYFLVAGSGGVWQ